MRLLNTVSATVLIAVTAISFPVKAQTPVLPAICYDRQSDRYVGNVIRNACELIRLQQLTSPARTTFQPGTSENVHSDGIDYIEFGANIQQIYERSYSHRWDDGARGFIGDRGDVYRITKQVADDGDTVYFFRRNSDSRIYRYNASQNAAGYTDIWSYSVASGYLKCRVTMVSANGQYLSTPQVTQVETDDMYPAIRTLLAFE